MWTSTRRSRTGHHGWSHVGVAISALTCVALTAGCMAADAPPPASTTQPPVAAPLPEQGDLDAGTYLVTGYPVPFEITVPDGWEAIDGAVLAKDDVDHPDDGAVFLLFWPVGYVPTDACAWVGALEEIGPSVEAFVDAMTAQGSTVSTPPVEVSVGDYSGIEFDHSVESGIKITDCDSTTFCIHSDRPDGCARWYSAEDERETYRVVDLNGERAVIAVGQFHQAINPALVEEARAVFDSIVFISDE